MLVNNCPHNSINPAHRSVNFVCRYFVMDRNCRCNSPLERAGEAEGYLGAVTFDHHAGLRTEFHPKLSHSSL